MDIDYEEYQGFLNAHPSEYIKKCRSSNNMMLTEGLFVETIQQSSSKKNKPLYSLKEFENKGLPSAYQIYMNSASEDEAARKLVGCMSHWRKLMGLTWFMEGRDTVGYDGLYQWRADKAAKDRTEVKKVLIKKAKEGDVSAARALDKMAQDEIKNLPNLQGKGKSSDDDGFLDEILGNK